MAAIAAWGQAPGYRAPRTADGKPNLNGIWQANNSANWNLQGHSAAQGPLYALGAVFSAQSLASIQVPTLIYEAELDRYLVPRFHAEWIAQNAPAVDLRRVPNAWHWAFMDIPGMPIATPDGDVGADPPGFDRPAFLKQLSTEIAAYFEKSLSSAGDERSARPLK